jgi:hypothetical protein
VAAEEAGAFGGGLLGGAIGGAVGGGLTAVLLTNPGGWIVVGVMAGSVSLGHVGSEAGRWAGRKVLQSTREFVEGVNTLGEFQIDVFWKKARSKHPGCPPEVCGVPDDPDEDFYRRGGHLEKENRLQRRPF